MVRNTPDACTRRNMARFGRGSPSGTGSRGDPGLRPKLVNAAERFVEFDEIEKILTCFK